MKTDVTPLEYISGFLKLLLLRLVDATVFLPLRVRYMITDLFSFAACAALPRQRRAVRNNLRLIRGTGPRYSEILLVFREYGRYWAETVDMKGFWKKATVIDSGPDFPPREKCFLGLTFHIGNFEIFSCALFPFLKKNFIVVAERLKPQCLADYFKIRRDRSRYTTVPHDDPRAIIKVLADGNALGIVCDRGVGTRGVDTVLFGRHREMPLALLSYALRHGIAVYVAYCAREDGGLRLRSIRIDPGIGFEKAVAAITGILEDAIRKYPFQWHMLSEL